MFWLPATVQKKAFKRKGMHWTDFHMKGTTERVGNKNTAKAMPQKF